ncbi:MAG: hypothetical protein PWQ22_994 [Archaeoglobaceae archaeon]|nr:hypothetical protein [Archaeoglobaceae archaeon]
MAGYNGERALEEEINKVHVIRWPVFSPKNAYHIPRRRKELLTLLNDFRCDVTHVHNAHSVFPVWCGLNVKASKLVFTPHYHGEAHTFLEEFFGGFGNLIS